ncbi:MAG: hypothetical protein LBU98_04545 [Alistipes sp.]|jgi:hypothetical protein|nr:hypothetical protein [Alistipes sp.]
MMEKRDNFSELIRTAAGELPAVSPDLERQVMIEIARRALARSRRQARRGLVASLAGLAMLLAGCIAALAVWYPVLLPALTSFSWLNRIHISLPEFSPTAETIPFLEEWGGLVLLVLLIGCAVGFIYYLNTLFSNDYTAD